MNTGDYLWPLLLISIIGYLGVSTKVEKCCMCACSFEKKNIMIANCNHRSLDAIPHCSDIENNTSIFLLSDNNISRIEGNSFARFLNLSKLDLSNNKIHYIDQTAFENLENLKILYINNNALAYLRTVYKINMFKSLTRVTHLKMNDNNNYTSAASLSYPDYALEKLSDLQVLFIDGIPDKHFEKGFLQLTNLQTLHVSLSQAQVLKWKITRNTFKCLPYLKHISLINSSLYHIVPGSFEHHVNLHSLNLSDNMYLGLDGVTNATHGISTALEILDISRIVTWDSLCVVVHNDFAANLQNTSLTTFIADDNKIEGFDFGTLPLFPKTIQNVSIRGHRFMFGRYAWQLNSLRGLVNIDLTGKDWRNFKHFQSTLHSIIRREQLNVLQGDSPSRQEFKGRSLPVPPNLRNVTFTYAQMYYKIGNVTVRGNNIETINVSRNLFTRWIGPVYGLEGLQTIDLSYNFAHTVTEHFFRHFPNLTYLDLSHNFLGNKGGISHKGNVFEGLTKLRFLDLTENYIANMSQSLFSNLVSLRTLILSKNRIHNLDFEISGLKHLKALICQNNNIQWLTRHALSGFDKLTKNNQIKLDLSGNPIACTCDNLHFLNWMLNSKVAGKIDFGNLSNYRCYYTDGRNEDLADLESVYSNVRLMCFNYVGMCIGMSCVVFGSLSLIIVGLLYRFRWKLRYFYYAARHRVNAVPSSSETNHNYTFDAFLSFAEEDRDFVVNELLNKLEGESNLELNFHQRNFRPGRPIAENIIEAVKTSKRTLLILTENFLESYWCIYELQMANMESVTTGRDVLLIVMMEHIPTRKIPTQILYHIQTDSYLQYPSEGDTDMFWRNLTDSLKRILELKGREESHAGTFQWYYRCLDGHRCKPCVYVKHNIPVHDGSQYLSEGHFNKEGKDCPQDKTRYILQEQAPDAPLISVAGSVKTIHLKNRRKLSTLGITIGEKTHLILSVRTCSSLKIYFGDYELFRGKNIIFVKFTHLACRKKTHVFMYDCFSVRMMCSKRYVKRSSIPFPKNQIKTSTIWLQWNNSEYVATGKGDHPGENVCLAYNTPNYNQTTPVNDITLENMSIGLSTIVVSS